MPVHLLDNYPIQNIESLITKKDGSPLHGEIWLYKQFQLFNENNLIDKNDNWFLKHDYNLSNHPSSEGKVEGQIDYILINKHGILIIEVKGGAVEVFDGVFRSRSRDNSYDIQDPFKQVKEYVHSLKELMDIPPFIYRAVVFPHEAGFKLIGPELSGYKHMFFSKSNFGSEDDFVINKRFFSFLGRLSFEAKKKVITKYNPGLTKEQLNKTIWKRWPELNKQDINRIKSELFPNQRSYGYNPDSIRDNIISNENYEILKGLRKNRQIIVQGAPGSGKTVLAKKFLAENLLKQQKGIFFCANKLIKSKIEHLIINEHKLDSNRIDFKVYPQGGLSIDSLPNNLDFIVFDEAQEYITNGLYDLIESLNKELKPKVLILYDLNQTIKIGSEDLVWYIDLFIESSFVHYSFNTVFRSAQNNEIQTISRLLRNNKEKRVLKEFSHLIQKSENTEISILEKVSEITQSSEFTKNETIVLVNSSLIKDFIIIINKFFRNDFEELTDNNINFPSSKIRFTTPIKYRGLESKSVYLITPYIDSVNNIENYIGTTRAITSLKYILWK